MATEKLTTCLSSLSVLTAASAVSLAMISITFVLSDVKNKLGQCLVRSYRSNPFLKQDLGKARFGRIINWRPWNKKRAATNGLCRRKRKSDCKSGLFLDNRRLVPTAGGTQTLLFTYPVKTFAKDQDECASIVNNN